MQKTKHISWLLTILICFTFTFTSFIFSNPALAASPVTLHSAQVTEDMNTMTYTFKGFIELDNLAWEKNVAVVYKGYSGEWQTLKASYYCPSRDNKEIWSFTVTEPRPTYYRATFTVEFAIKYEVNGTVYWDNNNSSNYILGGGYEPLRPFILGSATVLFNNYNIYSNSIEGYVAVKQLPGTKKEVIVRYTTDNWASYKDIPATFAHLMRGTTDQEAWRFDLPAGSNVKFAIAYKVDANTYWDNNFGKDYSITVTK